MFLSSPLFKRQFTDLKQQPLDLDIVFTEVAEYINHYTILISPLMIDDRPNVFQFQYIIFDVAFNILKRVYKVKTNLS